MWYRELKILTAGILIGGICSLTAQSFASSSGDVVTAIVDNLIRFEINGELKSLPQGYNVLQYRDRIYVPTRFVAEEMGGEVEWDSQNKIVRIKQLPIKVEKEEINTDIDADEAEKTPVEAPKATTKTYQKPSISKDSLEMMIGVAAVTEDNGEWKAHIMLENKRSTPLQLLQGETQITVDDVEYSMKKVPAHKLDTKWYNDVRKDEKREGYILLPAIRSGAQKLDLVLTVIENDTSQKKHTIEFNISLEGIEKE
ncbi:stalk domain-containing protein [Geosporobacter ferrireducens]|uniref:stalk domain-containing protein n=1 Tax=Geosporobacter ferrireducens TaxID=1424294 RepID=UPI00139B8B42|nr:stalk domain-containing protein [Geosporobacter ferrireducens]MTI53306.1 copper amine oxidase N-terminal domain-containing protein [Geosporobacter ferrireducens]